MYHSPVMLEAAIDGLSMVSGGTYVDATYGGGSHSAAILQRLGNGKLIAFDQDEDARRNIGDDPRLTFFEHNFRYIKNILKFHGHLPVDGILADLGVSSYQFDQASRGFSTRSDGPLDMRMNRQAAVSAKDILNSYDDKQLAGLFYTYGELKNSRRIAAAIINYRRERPLETTAELAGLLEKMAPRGKENKFLAQVFQALRIEVNQELDSLKELLIQSTEVLKTGGRLVVISYHSLEDRLVKNFIKTGNFSGNPEKDFFGNLIRPLEPVGKMQTAGKEEIVQNPRARSAKLRIAEKVNQNDRE